MLSIVIITKNEEKLLPVLLDSIKKQKFAEKYEIILSDAKSTDKTREIAKSYGCRIVDGGLPGRGRNNGAKAAKGNILLFLDADVIMPDNFLEKNLTDFNKRGLVSGTTRYKANSNKLPYKIYYNIYSFFLWLLQVVSPYAAGYCIFIKKEIFFLIGGFNEKAFMAEDTELIRKSVKKGKFRLLRGPFLLCDTRRLEKEGIFRATFKYLWAEIIRIFRGDVEQVPFNFEMQGVNLKDMEKKKRKN